MFSFLTLLTQVGGLVYLTCFLFHRPIRHMVTNFYLRSLIKLLLFLVLYCLTTFLLVPLIAKPFGRVPLPMFTTHNLRPANKGACLLNRNYVRPELRALTMEVADSMAAKYPGNITNYLDASFPFINHFGMFPHLSHNDGKKLDLSFCYNKSQSGLETNEVPSSIGYGISEGPLPGEINTAEFCGNKGYWQYSLLTKIVPQGNKKNFTLNQQKTKDLVLLFAAKEGIGKIFIEPHLKVRMNLTSEKIRFHGCRAVRHDDHLHVQLR